ncbi:MAG TPA: hypothetical protein VLA95_04135 [Gemmatimonadales bacterium]|nr:hypothetical protein [Gemmatimonadales bacterium]
MKAVALVALGCVAGACPAGAQDSRCLFRIDHVGRQGAVEERPDGTNYYAGGGVRLSCAGTSVSMASDSVAAMNGGEVAYFIGDVQYRDSTVAMDADRGTYFKNGERWEARGNVRTRNLANGSELTGPSMDYLRPLPGLRPDAEVYSTGRPTIVFRSATPGEEPFRVVADRVRFRGNDRIWTGGTSQVSRSDFAASADSIRLDTGPGSDGTLIGGEPVVRGLGEDPFELRGTRIDLRLRERRLDFVTAKAQASAVSGGVRLVADTIGLDVERDTLVQTLAWGKDRRPEAVSDEYTVRADSLAVDTPGQRLRELRGFGRAFVESRPDSVTGETNWLEGDSVTAGFAPSVADTTKRELRTVEARGSARSYYQIHDPKSPGRPSVDYARGDRIRVTFLPGGAVERVDVVGRADGVHLEPGRPPAPDSAVADTTRPPAPPGASR